MSTRVGKWVFLGQDTVLEDKSPVIYFLWCVLPLKVLKTSGNKLSTIN